MKHTYLLLAFLWGSLLALPAQAQTPDSLSQKLSSIFAHVDKSQVPTGYLYEAGVRFLEPRLYSGVLGDSNLTDMNVLRYLYTQMRSCRVVGQDTLPTIQAFNTRLKAAIAAGSGAIPIALQYERYASIRRDAVQNNLLTVQNEQVYDVAGRSQSPYQANILFAAAPDLSYSHSGTVSFLLRRNLYLTSSGAVPTSIYLNFDDGQGYRLVAWDQPLSTTYPTGGRKRVKIKIEFTAKKLLTETRESHFDFEVLNADVVARYDDNYGFSTYLRPRGAPYGATVSVRYGRGHGPHVVKPFIV